MIDPTLALAFAIHSNKGVFALLVGSGLSRSAGVMTGWEIVLDLIRRLAALTNEDCEPDPAAWYRRRFGEEADYSKLLNQLARSPAERQQLLRTYFEPTEDEREQRLKTPTPAHRAIARLAAGGYVRVILTTNFDRLVEDALREAGVSPTVISTPDQTHGALPLAHANCTVVKVHGDYLDTRIRNTPSELADYDAQTNALLDRVFDEYGLVVAGWSAQWDGALRAAIERCPSRRFTTYWAARGNVTEEARRLIEHRRAVVIEIQGADSFFEDLKDKVLSLDESSRAHPLAATVAAATLKRYLPETRHRIRVHDLVMEEASRVHADFAGLSMNMPGIKYDTFVERIRYYDARLEVLRALLTTGCYWGEDIHEDVWRLCLERIVDQGDSYGGNTYLLGLRLYPALSLLYAGGIAAVAARKYGNLGALLLRAHGNDLRAQKAAPLADLLTPESVVKEEVAQRLTGDERRHFTPVSDHFFGVLREPLRELLPRDADYEKYFDRFEQLFTLVAGDLYDKQWGRPAWQAGRFLWLDRRVGAEGALEGLYAEIAREKENWAGFRAGLFDGSLERYEHLKSKFEESLPGLRSDRHIF